MYGKRQRQPNFAQSLQNLGCGFQGINEFVESAIKQRLANVDQLPVIASFDSALFSKSSQFVGYTFPQWAVFTHQIASQSIVLMVKEHKVIPTACEGTGPCYKRKKLRSETEILDVVTFGQEDENLLCLHVKSGPAGNLDFLSMIPEHIESYEIAAWDTQMSTCVAADYRSGNVIVGQKYGMEILDIFSLKSFYIHPELNTASLTISKQSENLYCGSSQGYLYSIDFRTPTECCRAPVFLNNPVTDICTLNDGFTLVLSSFGSEIKLFDARMNRSIFDFPTVFKVNPISCKVPLSIDQSNRSLCSACQDGNIRIWNLRDGSLFKELEIEKTYSHNRLPGVAFSSFKGQFPSSSSLLMCNPDGLVRSFAI